MIHLITVGNYIFAPNKYYNILVFKLCSNEFISFIISLLTVLSISVIVNPISLYVDKT